MQRSCCKSSELVDMNRNAVFYYVAGIVTAITLFTFKRLLSPNSPSQGRRKKAVFFGDSITSHGYSVAINGWLCNFAEWWVRRVDVINRGFSGYNSRWGLMIVGEIVVRENPDIVFVFFGANDAVDKAVGQHVPLDEYRKNMQGIVEKIKTGLPLAKIVLITPPPIWEDKLAEMNISKGKFPILDRTNERTHEYVEEVILLGKKIDVPVVDAWTSLSGRTAERAMYLSDGLHLNAQGNYRLFEAVKEVVLQRFPEFSPESLPMHMHEWAQMIELDKQRGINA